MPEIQPAKPINVETTKAPNNHSNFDLSRYIGLTPRFGVNTAFYSEEVVPKDGPITIEPSCDTRSYTLKSPMFGDIKKHVAFYQVPLQAILPNNWEKVVVNASHGNDVQGDSASGDLISALDGVNCVVSDFAKRLYDRFASDFVVLKSNLVSDGVVDTTSANYIYQVLYFLQRWELFFSHGSLLSNLGVHYSHLIDILHTDFSTNIVDYTLSFDGFCQALLSPLTVLKFTISDSDSDDSVSGSGAIFVRKCLDFIRTHVNFSISLVGLVSGSSAIEIDLDNFSLNQSIVGSVTEPLNFGRLVSYQLVNAHYYTNDKVDYVYTADLYRQYISSLLLAMYTNPSTFSYNGITCLYDWLSGFYMDKLLYFVQHEQRH